MATFARSTFDAAAYLAHRPTYPRWLYERVLRFHAEGPAPKWQRAVDLGCGPGISTLQIVPHFKDTVGVDPSERMVAAAARPAQFSALPDELRPVPQPGKTLGSVDYRQGNAEELPFIENESVDLVTAGQVRGDAADAV